VLAYIESKEKRKRQEFIDILVWVIEPEKKEKGNMAYLLNK
jgi:quinol monooxygenase YgiN